MDFKEKMEDNFKKREECLDSMDRLLKVNDKAIEAIVEFNEPSMLMVLSIIVLTITACFIFI